MLKNKKKWIFLGIVAFLLIVFGLYRYYIYVTQDIRAQETAAILKAKQETSLVKVTEAQKSVWDTICWAIEGLDKDNRPIMVWVTMDENGKVKPGEGAVHEELLSNGMSENQIKEKATKEIPDVKKLKVVPGMYNGEYAWQLFYWSRIIIIINSTGSATAKASGYPFTLPNR